MKIYLAYFLLTALLLLNSVLCGDPTDCPAWNDMEKYVQKDIDSLSCSKNADCTGMNCSGEIQGNKFSSGVQIYHCEDPVTIKLSADVPRLGIHNWQRSFVHKATFDLSGEIAGEFDLQKDDDNFTMGLKVKLLPSLHKYFSSFHDVPLEFQIFKDVVILVPSCENKSETNSSIIDIDDPQTITSVVTTTFNNVESTAMPVGNCSIYNSSCSSVEMCKQLNKSSEVGVCVCLKSYSRNENGLCVYSPEGTDFSPNHGQSPDASTSTAALLKVILVPICILVLLVVLIFTAIRYRIFQAIRNRLRAHVYEHLLLGQQEDNDEPLTDPIA